MKLPEEFILSEQPISNEIKVFTFDEFNARYSGNPVVIYGSELPSQGDGSYYVNMALFDTKHLSREEFNELRDIAGLGSANLHVDYESNSAKGDLSHRIRWLYGENFMILDDIFTKIYFRSRGLK